jgi:hypothetical protein
MRSASQWLLVFLILPSVHIAQAQQLEKVHRIGFLGGSSASAYASFIEAFQQGLRDLGYTKEKILIESRMERENSTVCPSLQPSWLMLRLT